MSRALVLGGGGVTGIAWEIGVLQGLAEAGVPIRGWDLVVGTSAGAVVGAKVLGDPDWDACYAAQARDDTSVEDRLVIDLAGRIGGAMLIAGRRRRFGWLPRLWLAAFALETMVRRAARPPRSREIDVGAAEPRTVAGPDAALARIGSLALVARTAGEARYVQIIADTIAPVDDWPGPLTVTAIDALTGTTVAFDRSSGAPVSRAVAASAAVPTLMPPIRVGGRPYVDGGLVSQTHAYLAAGQDTVLVIAPLATAPLDSEVADLRAAGRDVHVVGPSPEALRAIGRDIALLDPARRARAARAGLDDGRLAGDALVRALPGTEAEGSAA